MSLGRWVAPGWALVGSALVAGGCSVLLDFSPASDAGVIDADLGPCLAFEPNDSLEEAAALTAGTHSAAICPAGDLDFYRFEIQDGEDFFVEIRFANEEPDRDLEMRLYRGVDGMVESVSMGLGDSERIEHSLALGNQLPAGEYIAEVYGFSEAVENNYTIELSISGLPDAGVPDAGVPDASMP